MNLYSTGKNFLQQRKLLAEWKVAFALKRDYQLMARLANQVSDDIERLTTENPDALKVLLEGTREDIIANPVLSSLENDIFDDDRKTFGDIVNAISDQDFENFRNYTIARAQGKINLSNLKYIAMSGGGAKGFAYPGFLSGMNKIYVPENKSTVFQQVDEVSGTSAGSLVSLPYALGYSSDEIEKIVLNNNFGRFFDDSNFNKEQGRIRSWFLSAFMARQDKVELKYIEQFTSVITDRLIDHLEGMMYESYAISDAEYNERVDYIKNELLVIPFHDLRMLCDKLALDGTAAHWFEEARLATDEVYQSLSSSKRKKVKPFDTPAEAEGLIFAVRKLNKADKIQAFLEDLIEERLNQIPEKELDIHAPSLTTGADTALVRNVLHLLSAASESLFEDTAIKNGVKQGRGFWKTKLVHNLKEIRCGNLKGYDQCLQAMHRHSGITELEVDVALNAIASMKPSDIRKAGQLANNKVQAEMRDAEKKWLNNFVHTAIKPKVFEKQRTLYKRKLTFLELSKLAEGLPEYGFKKLHASMTQCWASLLQPLKQIDASADNPETDRMPIAQAVRHSMNLPLGFKSIEYHDKKYLDGFLLSNLPNHVFLNNLSKKDMSTLSCLLAGDEFYEKTNCFKDALKQGPVNYTIYLLNANYKRISHEDLMRSIIVRSGDVGLTHFGIDKKEKQDLIQRVHHDAYESVMNNEDIQLAFLRDRLAILESKMDEKTVREITHYAHLEPDLALEPGVFSVGPFRGGLIGSNLRRLVGHGEMRRIHNSLQVSPDRLDEIKGNILNGGDQDSIPAPQLHHGLSHI